MEAFSPSSIVKVPANAIIPEPKLTEYLLVAQPRNDKSKFLLQGGFTQDNPADLELAIRKLIAENDAVEDRTDRFGTFYEVKGMLTGVNGIDLGVVTIWLHESVDLNFRFITLIPD
jgi:hypothetical protein